MANPFDIFELLEQGCSPIERSIRQPGRCPGGDFDRHVFDSRSHDSGRRAFTNSRSYKLTKDVLVTP